MTVPTAASSPSTGFPDAATGDMSASLDLVPSPPCSVRDNASEMREKRRLIEQRSRQKRKARAIRVHARASRSARADCACGAVLSDPDAVWDEFLDDETKRTRDNVRRLLAALKETKQLTQEKSQLRRLLKEQQLVWNTVDNLLRRMEATDEWEIKERRWRVLFGRHFRPLTQQQCLQYTNDALEEMTCFTMSYDRQSSGLSFLGWRDSRRILPQESALQFSFDKNFRACNLTNHTNMVWRIFTEQELYYRLVHGGRAKVSMEILQQLSPTAVVVRLSENYDGLPVTFHEVFLVFRVKTETGFIQYRTRIHTPELEQVINKSSDLWATNNFWIRWDVLDPSQDPSSADYNFSLGGSLRGDDPGFLRRWMCEILAAIVRIEGAINSRPMLRF